MHILYHLAVFICGTRAFKVCQYFVSYLNTDIRWLADQILEEKCSQGNVIQFLIEIIIQM